MAYLPLAIETGAVYTLTTGSVSAVFNDPTSSNYVGMISEITGLDSADVRESSSDLVEADGGAHGSFFFARRPIVINCSVHGHATIAARSARIDRARRASNCMRTDGQLSWTNTGGPSVFTTVRRQQPFRESGAWVKLLQIALVSEFAYIFGQALKNSNFGVTSENQGSAPAYPLLTMTGASTNPSVAMTTTGTSGSMTFNTTGLTLASDETVVFDMFRHSGSFTAGARNGQSANRFIDFATTQWPYLEGNGTTQTFNLSGGGSGKITYRDTWV